MSELRLEIPLMPPSGNHYKTYRIVVPKHGGKPFVHWYLTPEGEAWFEAVAIFARGQQIRGKSYEVQVIVFVPSGNLNLVIDLDNSMKTIGDGLQHAGVIDSDKRISDLHLHRRIDAANPRTVIVVKTDQEQLL